MKVVLPLAYRVFLLLCLPIHIYCTLCLLANCDEAAILYDPASDVECSGVLDFFAPQLFVDFQTYCAIFDSNHQLPPSVTVMLFNYSHICQNSGHFCGINDPSKGYMCSIRSVTRSFNNEVCFTCDGREQQYYSSGTAVVLIERIAGSDCEGSPSHVALIITRPAASTNSPENDNNPAGLVSGNGQTQSPHDELDCHRSFEDCFNMCSTSLNTACNMDLCVQLLPLLLTTSEFREENIDLAVAIIGSNDLPLASALGNFSDIFTVFSSFPSEAEQYFDEERTESFIRVIELVLSDGKDSEWFSLEEVRNRSAEFLNNTELLSAYVARSVQSGNMSSYHFSGSNIEMEVEMVSDGTLQPNYVYIFPDRTAVTVAQLEIPVQLLCNGQEDCSRSIVASALVRNLPRYLSNSTQNKSVMANNYLLSTQVFGAPQLSTLILIHPIRMLFKLTKVDAESFTNLSCVFWDFELDNWSTSSVSTDVNHPYTVCTTTHLTSFSVLIDINGQQLDPEEEYALKIVSYIGCTVSIVSLTLTLTTLAVFRRSLNKGVLIHTHVNLVVALLLAFTTFVAGIETATKTPWLCTVVAALLHYFFLCVFCWMLAEGIMLYLLLVKVFGTAADMWYYLLILGWGIPFPIVGISVGIRYSDYGTPNYCWISTEAEHGTLWAFVAPVLLVITVNAVILILAVFSILQSKRYSAKGDKNLELVKLSIKSSIILLPLLGLTWAFGILAVSKNTSVFAWIFTVLNSLQGLFIFVLHVLRNEKVRQMIGSCITFRRKEAVCVSTAVSGLRTPEPMQT